MTPRMSEEYSESVRSGLVREVERDGDRLRVSAERGRDRGRSGVLTTSGDRTRSAPRTVAAVLIALALILPASAVAFSVRAPQRTAAPPPTDAPVLLDHASSLIGLWKVDAPSEGTQTWVRFTPGSVTVQRDRLLVFGSWVGGGRRIAAAVDGWDGRLRDHAVPWLEEASGFDRSAADLVLRDGTGRTLAVLAPAAAAPEPRDASPELMAPSADDDAVVRTFAFPRPVHEPGPVISVQAVLGRWRTGAAAADGSTPFLTLRADGTYIGSDGCNGIAGRWLLLTSNRLMFTASGRTQVGCTNLQPVPEWAESSRTATLIDGVLTLFDVKGERLGSFRR